MLMSSKEQLKLNVQFIYKFNCGFLAELCSHLKKKLCN